MRTNNIAPNKFRVSCSHVNHCGCHNSKDNSESISSMKTEDTESSGMSGQLKSQSQVCFRVSDIRRRPTACTCKIKFKKTKMKHKHARANARTYRFFYNNGDDDGGNNNNDDDVFSFISH